MKFTKEEISLCKQIAKKYKKEIEYGDWFINIKSGDVPFLYQYGCQYRGNFVLWTISDCLEFLKGRNYDCILYSNSRQLHWYLKFNIYPLASSMEILGGSKTPLEACLKAVLAVLEEA